MADAQSSNSILSLVGEVIGGLGVFGGAGYATSRVVKSHSSNDKLRSAADSQYLEMLNRANADLKVAKDERAEALKLLDAVDVAFKNCELERVKLEGIISAKNEQIDRFEQYVNELMGSRNRLERGVDKLKSLIKRMKNLIDRHIPHTAPERMAIHDEVFDALTDSDFRPFDPPVLGVPKRTTLDVIMAKAAVPVEMGAIPEAPKTPTTPKPSIGAEP